MDNKATVTVPNQKDALIISNELVDDIVEASAAKDTAELFDTVSLAYTMSSVRLLTMRGVTPENIVILVLSLTNMLDTSNEVPDSKIQ